MAVISGKDGTVSVGGSVGDATSWSISLTSNNPSWASSTTSGYKSRVAGIKDTTGSYSAKFSAAIPSPGDEAAATFSLSGSGGYTLDIIIDAVNVEVDMDDGDIVGYSVDWSGRGPVTYA